MNLDSLREQLKSDLKRPFSARALLDRKRMLEESSRKSGPYLDSTYVPFYYHLGKHIAPEGVLDFGFHLGLLGSAFLTSCKSVKRYLAFHRAGAEFYSPRLGVANLKDSYRGDFAVHVGTLLDDDYLSRVEAASWDLAIVNEELGYDDQLALLEFAWQHLRPGGLVVQEYFGSRKSVRQAFETMSKLKNRPFVVCPTRYEVAILER